MNKRELPLNLLTNSTPRDISCTAPMYLSYALRKCKSVVTKTWIPNSYMYIMKRSDTVLIDSVPLNFKLLSKLIPVMFPLTLL